MANTARKWNIWSKVRGKHVHTDDYGHLQQVYHDHRIGTADESGHIFMPLSRLAPGEQGHVVELRGEPEIRQHLLEMGFTAGASVHVVRLAPLADPMTVRIRGYQLSLRRSEADSIFVRRCPPEYGE